MDELFQVEPAGSRRSNVVVGLMVLAVGYSLAIMALRLLL